MTVLAGAIRWDAWYAEAAPAADARRSLSPAAFQYRAPWFANVYPADNLIDLAGGRQVVMDLEIQYAAAAGLSYWAFDQYSPASTSVMMNAWRLYQNSSYNNTLNWCMLAVSDSLFGSTGNYTTQINQYVAWFQQTNYQKVLSNRPLLYLFFTTLTSFGGLSANFAAMISDLRTACTNAGLGSPYIVVMNGNGPVTMSAIGADAKSGYIGPIPTGAGMPYAGLASSVQAWWPTLAASASMIPIAQFGWDVRPRIQNPPSWELPYTNTSWTAPGTVAQLASHLQAAVNFVKANPAACPANAIIIYSWTECDEGGGSLIPTIGDPPTGPPPALNGLLSKLQPILQAA
jgi:hypothetical protein